MAAPDAVSEDRISQSLGGTYYTSMPTGLTPVQIQRALGLDCWAIGIDVYVVGI